MPCYATGRMGDPSDFWERVAIKTRYECWLWTGSVNKHGYGTLKYRGGYTYAHRLAWTLTNGVIAKPTLVVMHKCDVPLCCNPSHLLLGTVADNNADMVAKGRSRTDGPKPKGHSSPHSKLSEIDLAQIRFLLDAGISQSVIAGQFGIGQSTVSRILRGETYGG